jgi:hypothetical protein
MALVTAPGTLFDTLQREFCLRYRDSDPLDLEAGTVVVVPSLTFPLSELRKIVAIQHYEERMLYLLLLLRRRGVRVIYLSSLPIEGAVIDYYLGFLPDPAAACERLHLRSVGDPAPRPLSAKLLERPDLLESVRELIDDPARAFVLPFNVTVLEGQLGEALGLPVYGPRPSHAALGSKTGSRRVARRAGVPVLPGAEDLWSLGEVEWAVRRLAQRHPKPPGVVVKLNNGFSGQGNAVVALDRFTGSLDDATTSFCAAGESWASFAGKIREGGAVVEELLRAPGAVSPSVQLRITPGGHARVLSTHDQVLGGPNQQIYLGCRFPADAAYRSAIQEAARRAAQVLAGHGVIGSFGIDFFAVPGGRQRWQVYLAEINLRIGGTTHPFGLAQLAMDATYDAGSGRLHAGGRAKSYVCTDNFKSERLLGVAPAAVIARLARQGLTFDPKRNTGVTLHLLGALRGYGKMGMTCIGDSPAEAEQLYREAAATLDRPSA